MESSNYSKAFKIILEKSVNADTSKNITVIYDEFFLKYFNCLSEVINELLYKVTYIFIPDSYQKILQNNETFYSNGEIELPKGINTAINNSDIVLNFLTGSSKSSKVRGAVLNIIKDNGCKVVHCPNISDDVLNIIEASSFEKIHTDCELMAWAIGNSDCATIITTGPAGEELELLIKLGGWQNDPFISAGIIFENSWGNITPGEAFCCPKSSNINGSICINGSLPGHVLKAGEYLCLHFSKGEITAWEAPPNSEVTKYMNRLEEDAKKLKDINWNKFAELGIGLNRAIKCLTGNPIFDEKMAGTIHIALGDNVGFGHAIQSHIHEDLVVLKPTLLLDNRKIIDNGKLKITEIKKWRTRFIPAVINISETSIISFKSAKIHMAGDGIKRKLSKGNRVGYIEIFNKKHKKLTSHIYNFLDNWDLDEIDYSSLIKKTPKSVTGDKLKKVIEIFLHYRMAVLKSKA